MADISNNSNHPRQHGKRRARAAAPRIDMTPMVDLAFLLLTFFILAANLILPKAIEMVTPKDGGVSDFPPHTISILLDEANPGKVWYYTGVFSDTTTIRSASLNAGGLRKILTERSARFTASMNMLDAKHAAKQVDDAGYKAEKLRLYNGPDAPVVIIKSTDNAAYGKLVDALDEIQIASARATYSFADPSAAEKARLEQLNEKKH